MKPNSFCKGASQPDKSDGFVLLLIVLVVLGVGATVLLAGLGAGAARTEQKIVRAAAAGSALNDARQILIAYLISPPDTITRPSSTIRPGTLPTPDSLGNGNYDGTEDNDCLGNTANGLPAVGSTSTIRRCLGKFPWRTIPIDVGGVEAHDPTGRLPWLAVSSNLIFNDRCLRVLNSDVATLASPVTPSCPGLLPPYLQPTALPHPWLKVVDQDGTLLSDKVAAVLILPGLPLTTETRTQARSVLSPGNPADYLDSVNLPLGCTSGCTLYDNAGLTNQFVKIPSGTNYPDNAQNTALRGQPLRFNDILVYLTIDEVMHYAEKRVAAEMSKALKSFTDVPTSFTQYPWLQPLSTSYVDSTSLYSLQNTTFGAFPFMVNDTFATYRTDFSWALNGATETLAPPVCFKIGTGPNRWVSNPLINTLNGSTSYGGPFAAGTAPVASGTCKWLGGTKVECTYDVGTLSKSVTPYSSQGNCTSQSSPLAAITLSVARTITLIQDTADCAATPVKTYAAATNTNVHRWSWNCGNTSDGILEVRDTISNASYNLLPTVATLTSGASAQPFALNGMRYNPIMPAWFFHNRWYATAFASWAHGAARFPATPSPNPCSPVTTLTVGGAAVSTGVLILAGPTLTGQTRPNSTISSYLDGANANAATTCIFANSEAPASSSLNDNILVAP